MPDNILSPKRITAEAFTDAAAAVARLTEIYERNVSFLRTAFEAYVGGEPLNTRLLKRIRSCKRARPQRNHPTHCAVMPVSPECDNERLSA